MRCPKLRKLAKLWTFPQFKLMDSLQADRNQLVGSHQKLQAFGMHSPIDKRYDSAMRNTQIQREAAQAQGRQAPRKRGHKMSLFLPGTADTHRSFEDWSSTFASLHRMSNFQKSGLEPENTSSP